MTISRKEQLEIIKKMSDDEIVLTDPDSRPLSDQELARMRMFIPPEKRVVTIRIDSDILTWLKQQHPRGYQTLINGVLRDYMLRKRSIG